MSGIVYVLSNPSMPGIVKIGKTSRCPYERANELFTSGVPEEFVVEHAAWCQDHSEIENELHEKFSRERVSGRREFFRIDAATAIEALADATLPGDFVVHDAMSVLWSKELAASFSSRTGIDESIALHTILEFLSAEAMDLIAAKWQDKDDQIAAEEMQKSRKSKGLL